MAASLPLPIQECLEFVAAEGRYELQQDIFLDQVLPHPVIPTYVSSVSVKYKDYAGNEASGRLGIGALEGVLSASNLDRLDEQLKDLKVSDPANATTSALDDDEPLPSGQGANTLSGNFHGNLVDLPLYQEESLGGYKSPKNAGMMSPGPPQVLTPGPPPLKDSTPSPSSNRLLELQFSLNNSLGNSIGSSNQPITGTTMTTATSNPFGATKSLGRAASLSQQSSTTLQEEGPSQTSLSTSSSFATVGPSSASSAGFTSFFSGKRKKPKSNITKTNSTFVAKITTNEHLSKILANRVNEDVYVFWNTGRTFSWSDLGQKPNEPLSHISFARAFPTTHDVNILTRSCDHLDVIIGFSTGDIIWFNPLSNKYSRLNKQTIIKDSAVTMIKWMPGSESQFMASFQDGTIIIMDKDRDDNTFSPSTPPNENSFYATKPKHGRHNPLSHWNISRKSVTAFAFSPDLQHVAVVAADGGLRIIDFRHERLIETFQSYFGALSCVCWSPDGKYVLTGGQDDLVTIWSFKDLRIVARCQGHQSYVTGVGFDSWRCDERNYRFGSVGEDAKLLLWDFSVSALHKPKAATMQRRGSNGTLHGAGGAFKPGHRSKGSITSLRGSGGHSLFSSGHSKSSLAQQITLAESMMKEDSSQQKSKNASAAASIISSKRDPFSSHLVPEGGAVPGNISENASISGESVSMISDLTADNGGTMSQSVSGETISTTGTSSGNSITGGEERTQPHLGSQKKPTMQQARGLPHLHLHRPTHHGNMDKNGGGSNEHATQHGLGLSSMFHIRQQDKQTQQQQQQEGPAQEPVMRPPEPRARVAMLQPLMAVQIHHEPLASITFREDAIMTSDRRGHIKVWKRPSAAGSVSSP